MLAVASFRLDLGNWSKERTNTVTKVKDRSTKQIYVRPVLVPIIAHFYLIYTEDDTMIVVEMSTIKFQSSESFSLTYDSTTWTTNIFSYFKFQSTLWILFEESQQQRWPQLSSMLSVYFYNGEGSGCNSSSAPSIVFSAWSFNKRGKWELSLE